MIHGASAGATSVTHHLAAHDGRDDGLFVGAIGESIAWTRSLTISESDPNFAGLAARLNCTGTGVSPMRCLRTLDASTVQTLGYTPHEQAMALESQLLFQPVIDGDLFTAPLYHLFAQGKFLAVPLIAGCDTNEGSLFAPNASQRSDVVSFVQSWSPQLQRPQIQQLLDLYPPAEFAPVPGRARFFPPASQIFADGVFLCPTAWITSRRRIQRVWSYRYNVRDHVAVAAGLGVPHTFETEAIFGPGQAESIRPGFLGAGASYSTYNAAVVPLLQNYLISFVKDLDPNSFRSSGSPFWAPSRPDSAVRLKIQTNRTAMEALPHDLQERCDLWYSFEGIVRQGK